MAKHKQYSCLNGEANADSRAAALQWVCTVPAHHLRNTELISREKNKQSGGAKVEYWE